MKKIFLSTTLVMAMDDLNLGTQQGSTFQPLTDITVPNLLSSAISLVLIVVVVTFFFILILGGLKWITSNGDEKKLAAAKAQITHAFIGLAIVLSVWAIINLIQVLFGIDILTDGISIPSFNKFNPTPNLNNYTIDVGE